MKKTKFAFIQSMIALLLCVSMFVSTTFAWFTDSVSSDVNRIVAGSLDIELDYLTADGTWKSVQGSTEVLDKDALWEPGYTEVAYLRITNAGNLALKYVLGIGIQSETGSINVEGKAFKLSDYIEFGVVESESEISYANRAAARDALTETKLIREGYSKEGSMKNKGDVRYVALVVYMPESVGNVANYATGSTPPQIELGIQLVATQETNESDSFGSDYDTGAEVPGFSFPEHQIGDSASEKVTTDNNNKVADSVTIQGTTSEAVIPAGVQLEDGVGEVTLAVTPMSQSDANITLGENEEMISLDVHVQGVSADNTVPMEITIKEAAAIGLNAGNLKLYHVENGVSVAMTAVDTFTAHNQFKYDPATGDVTLYMATFSEVALIADTENAWNGAFNYDWYDANADELTIANADQLAAFGAIVGGMAKDEGGTYIHTTTDGEGNEIHYDSFSDQTVKLLADINLGDAENANEKLILYPIGYYNSEGTYEKTNAAITSGFHPFEGTFDGNGHTISNFYQNTWEMKGDHNWYDATLQYYRDGMGLFGKVYGGTVKNLTVENFSSDGEIATTGVIAAYADCGATFENIAVFNCNPRVYNIGNGGIVGVVGWYANDGHDTPVTFRNITVDNTNKISALWGSWDVACGGLVGQYYPTSGQENAIDNGGIYMENCHVAAQIDVYNDVCANYQYYAYRYAGILIGSVRENETIDDYVYPNMDGITASGCTVHFGDWNDYYYCELVANSTASYTHDYQMSRLEQVASVSGTTVTYLDGTIETITGTRNFVVVNGDHATENATCYHFVDGVAYSHDGAGKETVDGVEVDVEDKQHIYLEFNNLVTGYGWGVTSKGVGEMDGVTILDREDADSVVKFDANVEDGSTYTVGETITIGELFKAATIEDEKLAIKDEKVQVTVSPVGTDSNVSGVYTANTIDWTQGTLTLYGTGAATVIITDYYFCKTTAINITVDGAGFMYRVGNAGHNSDTSFDVTYAEISNMLTGKDTYSSIEITEAIDNHQVTSSISGTNVNFENTGVIGVKVDGKQYYLEVVDAVNTTTATSATANNVVLLNDVDNASNITVADGYAFYGNGFELNYAGDGSYGSAALSYGFVTVTTGGTLDHVDVVCKIFPKSYAYTSEMSADSSGRYPYGYSAVVVSGNSTISNCYIYGARNNIQVGPGNVTISNTITECGSLSNIHVKSTSGNTVILDSVTTVQYQTKDDFDNDANVLGFGVVVGMPDSASNPTIKLTGDFVQDNWVTSDDTDVSNSYAKSAIESALKVEKYQHTNAAEKTTVNMGIAYLNALGRTIEDQRTNTEVVYGEGAVSISGYDGYVYSIIDKSGNPDAEVASGTASNAEILPTVSFIGEQSDSVQMETSFDTNTERWVNTLTLDLDNISGGSYNFSFSNVKVQKYGVKLSYTVKDSEGNEVDIANAITVSQLFSEEYTLVVSDTQLFDQNGTLTGETVTRELPFVLYATKTSIDPPEFSNLGEGSALKTHEISGTSANWRPAYAALEGITVSYWSSTAGQKKTINLSGLNTAGTINGNVWTYTGTDFTLTITGGQVHTDGSVISPIVVSDKLYFWSASKAFGTGTTSRIINLTYTFTDNNTSTTETLAKTVYFNDLTYYKKSDFEDGTLAEGEESGECIVEGTLITMADGSQKPVEELVVGDMILAFNHITGEVEAAPLIFNTHENEEAQLFDVLHLKFSNGEDIGVVESHGFFDVTLMKYVYIDYENCGDFVGHRFYVAENETVTLTDAYVETELTRVFCPVTYFHMNSFANGVLNTPSIPGGITGLVNYFEYDEDLKYNAEAMERDVEKYGVYTYDDFSEYISEAAYNSSPAVHLKVAVGKGMITFEEIIAVIEYLLAGSLIA